MQKTYTFTLSRGHKIVERLNAEITESERKSQETLLIAFQLPSDRATIEKQLNDNANVCMEHQKRIHTLIDIVTGIRQKIGQTNVKARVSDKLAEKESLDRKLRNVRSLIDQVKAHGTKEKSLAEFDRLHEQFTIMSAKPDANVAQLQMTLRGRNTLGVLSEQVQAELDEQANLLKKQIRKLSDEINDANQKTISVELDETLAETLGL